MIKFSRFHWDFASRYNDRDYDRAPCGWAVCRLTPQQLWCQKIGIIIKKQFPQISDARGFFLNPTLVHSAGLTLLVSRRMSTFRAWSELWCGSSKLFLTLQKGRFLFNRGHQAAKEPFLLRWHLYFPFLSSVIPQFLFHIPVSRASNNVNKTAAQIPHRLPYHPPPRLQVTHLNKTWWETGSRGVGDYTVLIPNEKAGPYSLSLPALSSSSILSFLPYLSSSLSIYLLIKLHP